MLSLPATTLGALGKTYKLCSKKYSYIYLYNIVLKIHRAAMVSHFPFSPRQPRAQEAGAATPTGITALVLLLVHKKLGGGTARTADPNWPKGYSIPYGVMLGIETGGSWPGTSDGCSGTGWALAKQPQFPQPLLRRLALQTLHQLCCPSLDTLQHLHVSLVVRGPKLNTAFEVRPHQCRVQGHDHFPSPAGHTIPDTSQDAVGFLGHLDTLLAHVQLAVHQHPQVLFPKPVALHGVAVAQLRDPTLGLVEPHTIDLGPSIQPVQVPLQSLPTLQQINTPTQLGVICNLLRLSHNPGLHSKGRR
ncbi:hypothetical protein QYF61_001791, partial [Mycteria americana]